MFDKKKRVYRFGGKTAEGDGHMRELLGGKGANLAEMSKLGMPVPAGFTITTECCAEYYSLGGGYTNDLKKEVAEAMKEVGCVYLAATGGAALSYAEGLSRVTGYDWLDLGMPEALWHFQTSALGPLVVAIDAEGNSLYEKVREKVAENLKKL